MSDFLGSLLNPKASSEDTQDDFLGGLLRASEPPVKSRNLAAVANDTVIEGANAALGGVKTIADFVSPGNRFSNGIDSIIKEGESNQSDVVKAGKAKFARAMDSDDTMTQLKGVKDYVLENPLQTAAQAVGTFVTPGFAIKGAKLAGGALNLSEKAAARFGLGAGSATSAAMSGGDAGGSAYDLVYNSPSTQHLSPEERDAIATKAARQASIIPAAIGGIGGMFGADKALAMGTKSILKTGLQEFGTEAFEEGATQLSANLAARQYAPEVNAMQGVVGSAALGGVLGGGTGLAVGALTKQPVNTGSSLLTGGNASNGEQDIGISQAININNGTGLSTQDIINQTMGIVEQTKKEQAEALARRQADMNAAMNEPSGVRVSDPVTGIERELTQGEFATRQANQVGNEAQQASQQQQEAEQAAKAEALHKQREATIAKFGGATPNILSDGRHAGKQFLGKVHYGPETLLKAVDKISEAEAKKTEFNQAIDQAYIDAYRNNYAGKGHLTPTQLDSKVKFFLDGSSDLGHVITRIDSELEQLSKKKGKADQAQVGFLQNFKDNLTGEVSGQKTGQVGAVGAETTGAGGQASQELSTEVVGNSGGGSTLAAGNTSQNVKRSTPTLRASPAQIAKARQDWEVATGGKGDGLASLSHSLQHIALEASQKGILTAEAARFLQEQNAPDDITHHATLADAVDHMIQQGGTMTAENVPKIRALFQHILGTDAKDRLMTAKEIAAEYGLTEDQAKNWSKHAKAILDRNESDPYFHKFEAAKFAVANNAGFQTWDEMQHSLQRSREINKSQSAEAAFAKDELATEVFNQQNTIDEKEYQNIEDGESSNVGITSKKSVNSKTENFNFGEAVTKQWESLQKEIAAATKEGDSEKVAELEAKMDELLTKTDKNNKKAAKQNQSRPDAPVKKEAKKTVGDKIKEKVAKKKEEPKETPKELKPTVVTKKKTRKVVEKIAEHKASTALTVAEREKKAWNELPVPVSYEQLSPQAKADWALSVKDGKSNLAAASKVYEENQASIEKQLADDSRTIDGTGLITEVGEQEQVKLLTDQTKKLAPAQVSRLEKHYGEKSDSPAFMTQLKQDVINYVNKGAESVAGAIRDIIKQIAHGVMSFAVVFNPSFTTQPHMFAVPTHSTTTVEVKAAIPAGAENMSDAGKKAFATLYPALKDQLKANDKLLIITDKPTARNFIFTPDGKLLLDTKVLLGKGVGDLYKGNNTIDANKITVAGLFTMGMREGGKTASEYDYNKVFVLDKAIDGEYSVTMMHSVWTKESDAAQRLNALKDPNASNSRYSFGCINVDKATYGDLLAKHEKQMDGAKLFVVPDAQNSVMDFVNGKVMGDGLTRQGVKATTKEAKTENQTVTNNAGEKLASKEEDVTGNDNSKVQFSKTDKVENPETAAKVAKELKDFIGDVSVARLEVVQSIENLPKDIQAAVLKKQANGEGVVQGLVQGAKVYMIADNIEKGMARAVFMHEVGSHLGLENLLSQKSFDSLVDTLDNWMDRDDGSIESILAIKAFARAMESGENPEGRRKEYVAYFIEEAIKAGINPTAKRYKTALDRWFSKLWEMFREAVQKLGFNPDKFTAQDLINLAYGAARLEVHGSWHGTATEFEKFNHDFMGKGEGNQAFGWGTYLAQRRGIGHDYMLIALKGKRDEPQFTYKGKNFRDDVLQNSKDSNLKEALRAIETAIRQEGLTDANKALEAAKENLGTSLMVENFTNKNIEEELRGLRKVLENIENGKAANAKSTDLDDAKFSIEYLEEKLQAGKNAITHYESFEKALNSIDPKDIQIDKSANNIGNLMRVDVNVEDQELLDLDKPLDQQSTLVRAALKKIPQAEFADDAMLGKDFYEFLAEDLHGKPVRRSLGQVGDIKGASKLLDSAGIKGNIYLDRPSRNENAPANLQTRNKVIFNENNIFRIASQPGAQSQDIKFSFASTTKAFHEATEKVANTNIKKLPIQLQSAAYGIHSVLFNVKKIGLGFAITRDVVAMAKKYMASAPKYMEALERKGAITREHEEHIQKIMLEADKLDNATRDKINSIIAESTIKNYWAFEHKYDDGFGNTVTGTINPELAARFKALPAPAQKIVKDVFKTGHDTLVAKIAAVNDIINTNFAERIKDAGDDIAAVKKLEKEKAVMQKRFSSILKIDPNTPYAPLKRFGSFVVVATSKEFADNKNDAKWMAENESNEKHRIVEFASTMGEAKQIQQKLLDSQDYAEVEEPFEKSQANYSGTDLHLAFAKLQRVIRDAKDEAQVGAASKISAQLETMVNDLYLTSLADSSARKSEMQRKKIGGYNRDMLRSFFTQGMADAHYIANLQTNNQTLDAILAMQQEAKPHRSDANPFLNELMAHEAASLQVRPASMLDGINRFTGDMFLTFSPGFYLQQATQPFVISLPWMAGKYGYFKSSRFLAQAYKEIAPLLKGANLKEHADLSKAPTDVAEMLKELIGKGLIDIGIEQETYGFRSEQGSLLNPVNSYNKVTNALRGAINRVETLNRATTAMAAFRLEMQKSGDKAKAIAAATEVVHVTHGSYDGTNTPRYMGKNAFTRSVTQFRRFQIIQLSMLAREFSTMLGKDASNLERKIAAKQFAFLFAHTAVLAGAKGVPLYALASIAYSLAKSIGGDEDDPEDLEAYLREHGGLLLTKGIPAALGLDLSNKLGMGNTLSILPYTNIDLTSKGGVEKVLLGLSGPFFGGLLPKMGEGLGYMAKGEIYKGMEQVIPKGVSDGLKAARFATEGVTMKNGDQVLSADELDFADVMAQAMGIPTTKITERTYLQGELLKFEKFYKERTTEVKQDYTEAVRNKDTAAATEARAEWQKLQDARAKNGFKKQPLSELLKAPQAQLKREKLVIGGVAAKASNKGFLQQRSLENGN